MLLLLSFRARPYEGRRECCCVAPRARLPVLAVGVDDERSVSDRMCDHLLAAVDVVGRAGERPVRPEVDRERREVGWSEDPPDQQTGAQLLCGAVRGRRRGVGACAAE